MEEDASGFKPEKLSNQDAAALVEQVAALTRQELPLGPGLNAVAAELPEGKLKNTLLHMAIACNQGQSVPDVFAKEADLLPQHVKALVWAGCQSGRLSECLSQFVEHQKFSRELRHQLWSALAYPSCLLMFSLLVFSFIELYIVRETNEVLSELQTTTPLSTQFVLQTSTAYPWILCSVATTFVGAWLATRWVMNPVARRRLQLHIPLLGAVWRWTAWAEFCHLWAMLLDCQTPLHDALRWSAEAVRDANVSDAALRVAEDCSAGYVLTDSPQVALRFPPQLRQLLAWGIIHNSLPQALYAASDQFFHRARLQNRLISIVAPLVSFIVIIFVSILSVLLLFLPVANLLNSLL